jgi:hypothetical protein
LYYQEFMFHNPMLLAEHFNARGQFAEADRWLRFIFDPTARDEPPSENPKNRVWRYVKFRDKTPDTLFDILTDSAAIALYERDPFNPHAIARQRESAWQKAVIMKYIDNLLDWATIPLPRHVREHQRSPLYYDGAGHPGPRPADLGPPGRECASRTNRLRHPPTVFQTSC